MGGVRELLILCQAVLQHLQSSCHLIFQEFCGQIFISLFCKETNSGVQGLVLRTCKWTLLMIHSQEKDELESFFRSCSQHAQPITYCITGLTVTRATGPWIQNAWPVRRRRCNFCEKQKVLEKLWLGLKGHRKTFQVKKTLTQRCCLKCQEKNSIIYQSTETILVSNEHWGDGSPVKALAKQS